MKANKLKYTDLRIGNWVKVNDPIFGVNTYKVATIRDNGIITLRDNISCLVDNIEPIELTEEVLVKIGFEKDGNNYSLVCGDIEVGYYIDKFKQVLYINVSREKRFYKNELRSYDVKYLHQLQNVYYILTNEELEVEL